MSTDVPTQQPPTKAGGTLCSRHASLFAVAALFGPALYSPAVTVAAEPSTRPSPKTQALLAKADADMQTVTATLADLDPKPIEMLTPADARKQPTPTMAVLKVLKDRGESVKPEPVADVDNRKLDVTSAEGNNYSIPARVYTPEGPGPFPVIVYFHGGGFVIASLDTYDGSARALTNLTHAMVVSVDYRMAPENKWPAAHDDAYLATQWVFNHAGDLKGDPARVAVAGESAGGNLANAVSMMARDRGGKVPIAQLLVYPVAGNKQDTPSYIKNAEAKPLNRAMMSWFFGHYTTSASDAGNKYLAPLNAATDDDLKGLPPTTIITAQIDPLMSDGQLYAEKLRAAGVPVQYRNYDGVTHEFFGMAKVVAKARTAQQFAAEQLNAAFGASSK